MDPRPPVSLVVPFLGTTEQLRVLVDRLEALRVLPGDELIVADNRPAATGTGPPTERVGFSGRVIVHRAGGLQSPGFARNRAAARARNDWLVFIDADTEPDPGLLDAYFVPPPRPETGVLGGEILDVAPTEAAAAGHDSGSRSLVADHLVARAHMSARTTLDRPAFAYAQTANCAVRRRAFVGVGGFEEEIRAAEDADLCLRLAAHGWELESRPRAIVRHEARRTLRAALAQLARHGAGASWCNRRHPGSFPPPSPRSFLSRLGRLMVRALLGAARADRVTLVEAVLDGLEACAFELGRLMSNRVRR